MNYSNCCGVETHAEKGELIMCSACKEWAVAEEETSKAESLFKAITLITLLFTLIYFTAHVIVWVMG